MDRQSHVFLDDITNTDSYWVDEIALAVEKMARVITGKDAAKNAMASVVFDVVLRRIDENEVDVCATITARCPRHVSGATKIYVSDNICFYNYAYKSQAGHSDDQALDDFDEFNDIETSDLNPIR